MPIGPYKDFATCVAAQRRKGKSLDSARRICGEIEKRTRQGSSSKMDIKQLKENKDWRVLEFVVPIKEAIAQNNEFVIKGIAINETVTRNNVQYVAEELERAAPTLRNKPILKDHNNSVDSIVGRTTNNVMFNPNTNAIEFEGKIADSDMRDKINNGLIQSVSVGATVDDLIPNDDESIVTAKGIDFVELSLVAVPADPNAGFARAIAESFKLKEESEIPLEEEKEEELSKDDIAKEESKMSEEKLNELQEQLKASEEAKLKAERELTEIKKLQEEKAAKETEEKEKLALKEKLKEELKEELKVELTKEQVEEEQSKEEEKEDETQGEVASEEQKDTSEELLNDVVIEKSQKGFAIFKPSYDRDVYKRLGR